MPEEIQDATGSNPNPCGITWMIALPSPFGPPQAPTHARPYGRNRATA